MIAGSDFVQAARIEGRNLEQMSLGIWPPFCRGRFERLLGGARPQPELAASLVSGSSWPTAQDGAALEARSGRRMVRFLAGEVAGRLDGFRSATRSRRSAILLERFLDADSLKETGWRPPLSFDAALAWLRPGMTRPRSGIGVPDLLIEGTSWRRIGGESQRSLDALIVGLIDASRSVGVCGDLGPLLSVRAKTSARTSSGAKFSEPWAGSTTRSRGRGRPRKPIPGLESGSQAQRHLNF